MDDIDRLLNLLEVLANGVTEMSDEDVEAELSFYNDDGLNVADIIRRALARYT